MKECQRLIHGTQRLHRAFQILLQQEHFYHQTVDLSIYGQAVFLELDQLFTRGQSFWVLLQIPMLT
jgi:hypothetical protein